MTRLFKLVATRVPSVSAISRTWCKIRARIFGREIEHLLHDPGDRFAVAVGDGEQAEIIAFAQESIGRGHVAMLTTAPRRMVRKKTMTSITEKIERRKSTNMTGPAAIMASRILVCAGGSELGRRSLREGGAGAREDNEQ